MSFRCPECGHRAMSPRAERSAQIDAKVAELQPQGLTRPEIARAAGLSYSQVTSSLARLGLQAAPGKCGGSSPDERRRAEIIAAYRRTNSPGAAAEELSISPERVRQVLAACGIRPRSRQHAGAERRAATDARIAELHQRGLSVAEIIRRSGFAPSTVWASMARQVLVRNKSITPRVRAALRLFDEGRRIPEIAADLGYSEGGCRVILRRYGRTMASRAQALAQETRP